MNRAVRAVESDRGEELGRLVHTAIAMAEAGSRDKGYSALMAAAEVADRVTQTTDGTRSQLRAVRLAVISSMGVYRNLWSLPSAWRLLDTEVELDDSRADLVFEHADGRVLIDEIKAGLHSKAHADGSRQVASHLRGGRRHWGPSFVGVRLLPLAAPASARLFTSSTTSEPLTDGLLT